MLRPDAEDILHILLASLADRLRVAAERLDAARGTPEEQEARLTWALIDARHDALGVALRLVTVRAVAETWSDTHGISRQATSTRRRRRR